MGRGVWCLHAAPTAADANKEGTVFFLLAPEPPAQPAPRPFLGVAGAISVSHEAGLVQVDGWATFKAPARIAVLVRELRSQVG